MKRITFARLAVLMLAVAGLALQGCGGDDNGGISAADQARLTQAETDAAAAQAEADKLKADLAALQAQVDEEEPEDTSDLDEQIAALQAAIDALTKKTADPSTPPEILGGEKSTSSAADLKVLADKVAGELNEHSVTYKAATPPVNKPAADGTWTKLTTLARDPKPYATTIMDDHDDDGAFLTHTFKPSGTKVDLTGDAASLKFKGLLTVDGVSLMGVSMKETDKVRVSRTNANGFELGKDADGAGSETTTVGPADLTHTTTTTLRADGSSMVVTVDDASEAVVRSVTTTYFGGNKIVEYNPLVDEAAGNPNLGVDGDGDPDVSENDVGVVVTLANGRTITYDIETDGTTFPTTTPASMTAAPAAVDVLPAADLAVAEGKYTKASAAGGYTQAAHTLAGYGGWLTDSFFLAYTLTAGDEMDMKVVAGGREHDTDKVAGNLSGFGESATWKGLMAGHDTKGGTMVKGNASITARVGEATLADASAANVPDIVDVSLTNIITGDGAAVSRVAKGIHWTNLDLDDGSFAKGSEIEGQFYDGGNEVVGTFDKEDILGAFGAVEYEMMDTMDDM